MPASDSKSGASTRKRPAMIIAVVSLCALPAILFTGADRPRVSATDVDLLTLKPTQFSVPLELQGRVEPMESAEVKSQSFWSTNIISIVPEGTWVEAGDVICTLDAADIDEFARGRELRLIRYENLLNKYQKQLDQLRLDNQRKIDAAEFKHQSAEFELNEYLEGQMPDQIRRMEQNLGLITDRTNAAASEVEHLETMWAMGMVQTSALDKSMLNFLNVETERRNQESRLRLLTGFTQPRKTLLLTHTEQEARRDVTGTRLTNEYTEARLRRNVSTYSRILRIHQNYLKRALDSKAACTMVAPCSGQVLHGNSWYLKSRGITSIDVGKSVRYGQTVFQIPDQNNFKIRIPLEESLIHQVDLGMPAVVRLAGYEEEKIAARILNIPAYPRRRSRYSEAKDYWLEVELLPEETQRELITLKSDATIELQLFTQNDVLQLPRKCVVGIAGANYTYVLSGSELVPRKIELGQASTDMVVVTDGLQPGEAVAASLSPQHLDALLEEVRESLTADALLR